MTTKIYAPVVIPTLNRYEHLKRCIESLKECTGADKTDLVISIDYPPAEKYVEGHKKIKQYLPTIKGFHSVVILETNTNIGAVKNCLKLYSYVKRQGLNKCIFSEDDNEFSPNFLEYINNGFMEYNEDSSVMAICGYVHPKIHVQGCERFLGDMFSAWGVGMWLDRQFTYQRIGNDNYLYGVLNSWQKSLKLFRMRPESLQGFLSMHFKGETYGDVFKTAELLLEDKWCVEPTLSKVRNTGHDGSGINCNEMTNDIYAKQVIDERSFFIDNTTKLNKVRIVSLIRISLVRKAIIFLRYLVFRLLNKDVLKLYYISKNKS